MSFGFQFDDEQLDDEYRNVVASQEETEDRRASTSTSSPIISKDTRPAKKHTLQELISSLPPRISYSSLTVPLQGSSTTLYRRDLFDARFQLINDTEEDNDDEEVTAENTKKTEMPTEWETYSVGAASDLIPGVYEGGFKTWECSLDLIAHLDSCEDVSSEGLKGKRVTELGCGTAIPSMFLLSLLVCVNSGGPANTSFELCDYNEQVLRLVTLPNLLLNWYFNSTEDRKGESNGDLDLTPEVLEEFQSTLTSLNIKLDFYSGPWNALHSIGAFKSPSEKGNIVLTSETIYSTDSLNDLVQTLGQACNGSSSTSIESDLQKVSLSESKPDLPTIDLCLVAAKMLYFGVGGGVDAFNEELARQQASSKVVWNSNRGVARVVLQVSFSTS